MEGIVTFFNPKVLLAVCVALLGLYWFLVQRQRKNLPPGPWALPLIGNAIWFLRNSSSTDSRGMVFFRATKTYGDLQYFKLGKFGLLILNGFDVIQEFFVVHSEKFNFRPHWFHPALELVLKDGKGLAWQDGEDWKKMRKFAMQSLREFGVGKTSLEEKIIAEIDVASNVMKDVTAAGEPYDVRVVVRKISLNVLFGVVFGKRFDYEDARLKNMLNYITETFKRSAYLDVATFMPNFILKLIGRDKEAEEAKKLEVGRKLDEEYLDEIAEHEKTYDADNIRDFIDLYIQKKRAGEDMHLFTAGNMKRMALDLFLAGSDTTALTLLWCVLYMIEYPEVQQRCQLEIQETYGHQVIRWSHRHKLTYVEATLMEIQRLANVGELTMFRTNQDETTMRGYTVPKHTLIMANLRSANMDPRYWEEPETFMPDRFLDDEGKLKNIVAFIPFSIGPRTCPGEALARMQLFLVFTNLLQRFTFKRAQDDVPNNFNVDNSHLAGSPLPFKTRMVCRQ